MCFSGVEYYLQQLADVRPAGVVLCNLDDERPPPLRHDVRALPGHLRDRPGGAGLPERPAAEPGRAVPRPAPGRHSGLRPEQLPPRALRPPGGQGEPGHVFMFFPRIKLSSAPNTFFF